MGNKAKVALGLGGVGLVIVGIIAMTRKAAAVPPGGYSVVVELKKGWNYVTFSLVPPPGTSWGADVFTKWLEISFDSIEQYLIGARYLGADNLWRILYPGKDLTLDLYVAINVSQACEWAF